MASDSQGSPTCFCPAQVGLKLTVSPGLTPDQAEEANRVISARLGRAFYANNFEGHQVAPRARKRFGDATHLRS